jgi:hypothetical protein
LPHPHQKENQQKQKGQQEGKQKDYKEREENDFQEEDCHETKKSKKGGRIVKDTEARRGMVVKG